MFRRLFKIFGTAALVSAICSFAAFAATPINSVNFTYTVDPDAVITAGYNDPIVEVSDSAMYEVSDLDCASDVSSISGKTALSYTLTLSAKRNYYFPNASQIQVSGSNITQLTKTSNESGDNTLLTIKFKAYPYYRLNNPVFETSFDDVKGSKSKTDTNGRAQSVVINKNGAPKIEYVICYVDQYGDEQTKANVVTGTSINVSTYNKIYTGTSTSRQSAYIKGIAIRGAGDLGSNTNVVPSEWVFISGGSNKLDTEEFYTNYKHWEDFRFGNHSSQTQTSGTSSSGSNVNVFGWSGSGNNWYYYSNGSTVKGWLYDGSHWYYCDPSSGLMKTGWILDGGYWYYLNTAHDGTFGCMKTGWITDNGVTYYLKPNAGGPMGSMVTGTYTINGKTYNFSASGALIG